MEMIVDFILLAASGAATFYCIVLSRRLGALRATDKGIGASIAAMSKTLDETRAVLELARTGSAKAVDELTPLLEEARRLAPRLSELVDTVSELAEIAAADVKTAAGAAASDIDARTARLEKTGRAVEGRIAELMGRVARGPGHTPRRAPCASGPPARDGRKHAIPDRLEWLVG